MQILIIQKLIITGNSPSNELELKYIKTPFLVIAPLASPVENLFSRQLFPALMPLAFFNRPRDFSSNHVFGANGSSFNLTWKVIPFFHQPSNDIKNLLE